MQTSDRFLRRAAMIIVLLGTVFQLAIAQNPVPEQYYPQVEQGATLRPNSLPEYQANMRSFQDQGYSRLSPQQYPWQGDVGMDEYNPEYNTTTVDEMVVYFLGGYHSRVEVMNRYTGIGYNEVYVGVWRYQISMNGENWQSTTVYKPVHLLPGSTCQEYVDSILTDPVYTQLDSRLIVPSKISIMQVTDYDESTAQQVTKTVYLRLIFAPYDTNATGNGAYR